MARTKNKGIEIDIGDLPDVAANGIEADTAEARAHSELIIQQFGEGHPYERVRVIGEARFYANQSAEAMLEFGKRLVLIKEHEPHGDFIDIVENQLGMAARTARLLMQAALKYLSPRLESKRPTFTALGKSKLFELLAEDDDDLVALAEGGTVAGLTLDEVDRMSVRELRTELRESRGNAQAKDQMLQDKNAKIDELSASKRRIATVSTAEATTALRQEVSSIALTAEVAIGKNLWEAFNVLLDDSAETDISHIEFMASTVHHLEDKLSQLRQKFGLPAPAPRSDFFSELKDAGI